MSQHLFEQTLLIMISMSAIDVFVRLCYCSVNYDLTWIKCLSGINQHQIRWLCHASKETYTQHHLNSLSNMAWQLWLKKGASPVHGDSLSPQGDPSGDLPWVQLCLTHYSSDSLDPLGPPGHPRHPGHPRPPQPAFGPPSPLAFPDSP
jgi:hypothetical protein